jgi:hypothetical protein
MALHRDVFWIGRQWAVTGHGMQLIDQRLEGAFDIEVIRLWDDDLMDSLRAKAWLKAEDFDKALAVARTRHSQAPSTSLAAAGSCDRAHRAAVEAGAARHCRAAAAASGTARGREPTASTDRAAKTATPGPADENRRRRHIRAPLARLDEENMRKSAGLPQSR